VGTSKWCPAAAARASVDLRGRLDAAPDDLTVVDVDEATRWWANVSASAPTDLAGLWFGLVELSPGGWHIYVAGTETFDATDETAEWAAGPFAWWPDNRYLPFGEPGPTSRPR
jgi:hypothetical protein